MDWLFGKRKSPAEQLRENKRKLDRAIRDLDRERMSMQSQEKKLIVEMKKMAKQGQNASVKVMAKSLIRMRHQITKFYTIKSQLQNVSMRMQTLKATQSMADAMKGVTKALGTMNKQLDLPALQTVMREFEKQNEKMEMTSEVMGDAVDDAFEEEGEEEETDELVMQVMDEIGITLNDELVSAPAAQLQQQQQQQVAAQPQPMAAGGGGGAGPEGEEGGSGIDDDLASRLKNLRG